jgi:hypothetical protein
MGHRLDFSIPLSLVKVSGADLNMITDLLHYLHDNSLCDRADDIIHVQDGVTPVWIDPEGERHEIVPDRIDPGSVVLAEQIVRVLEGKLPRAEFEKFAPKGFTREHRAE